jgi:RNA polymerase sigma-70 factor, ECF subfamily
VRRLDPKTLHAHIDPMYRAAWALTGSREDAEDLVQDTFAQVLSRPRVIRGEERGYLLQALRNTFYTRLRTASRRPQTTALPDDSEPVDPRAPAPDRVAEVNEVLEAIAELPEDFRLAIVAIDILGLSYGEAAKALDTREATITTRLYRARQRIAKQFADLPAGGDGPAPDKQADKREGSGAGGVISNG